MQLTIDVPKELGEQLQEYEDRIPELLERGLLELRAEQTNGFDDEHDIIERLVTNPTPQEVLAIRPSTALQERVSKLLAKNKMGMLSRQDENELERYLMLEHLVRLAKAQAYKQLNQKS